MPLPVPLAPTTIVIHGTELVAVHAQVAAMVTCTVANAEKGVRDTLVGDTTALHGGAACVTVKVRPPTVRVALRTVLPVLALVA